MKRLWLVVAMVLVGICPVSAVRYQGFAELSYGIYAPSKYYGSGGELGLSTSHGVEIVPGVFVGLGVDWLWGGYKQPYNGHWYNETMSYQNMFVEGRYSLYPNKKISPFAGLRLGAGMGESELGSALLHPYISPAVGFSFNFSRRCGVDVGIGYAFHGINNIALIKPGYPDLLFPSSLIKVVNSSVQFRVGLHF